MILLILVFYYYLFIYIELNEVSDTLKQYIDGTFCKAIRDMTVADNTYLQIVDRSNKINHDTLYLTNNKFIRITNDGSFYIHEATKTEEIFTTIKFSVWTINDINSTVSGSCSNGKINQCKNGDDDKCIKETSILYLLIFYRNYN